MPQRMLTLHFANHHETLTALLTDALGRHGGGLFTPDELIVPSAAQRRQLTLHLAQAQGVCANLRFSFLAQWLWQQGARVLAAATPGAADPAPASTGAEAPWQPALLSWRVYAALSDAAWVAGQPRLARYLASADAVTRLDLAQRVASLIDQCITYRPDWLAAWAEGRSALPAGAAGTADEAWQAALWRRLQDELRPLAAAGSTTTSRVDPTAAHTLAAALARVDASPATLARLQQAGLPAAAHVFCLPTIAPVHLALLQQLGRWMDLRIYALNPCEAYWFELVDARRLARLAAAGRAQHHETGHRLLAAWGQQTQAQLAGLVDACGDGVIDDAHYTPHPGHSLLARLQNSVLDLQDLAPASVPLQASDRSIELHVCHSFTRELEVLQDTLLALMGQPGAPAPGEILVVMPDLEAAAPLIDSVFGTAPRDRALPFTITGRAVSRVNPLARALLDLLALAASRCTASAVFGLLQQPVVAQRFGLDDEGLARVHGWLLDAGVHWALDGEQRAEQGLPADPRHSFADGLDRLFLGHALPASAADQPFDGRLPAGDAEGSAALALGALWRFVDALGRLRQRVAAPLPAAAWPGLLAALVDEFLQADGGNTASSDAADLRAALQSLAATWQASTPAQPLPLAVVQQALLQTLDDPARGGVPTGRITFSAMSSLRNLPYRMVCVLGLNDGAFPGVARPAEFDLIAQHPRPGDRQRRSDERNLFLDLLLAARERLHLSHAGRSVRDNAPLPPSVLVSELLEYLVPALDAPPDAARAHLVVPHPLQAFDARLFQAGTDVRQRSHDHEYATALTAAQAGLADTAYTANTAATAHAATPDEGDGADAGGMAAEDETDAGDPNADADADAPRSAEPAFFRQPLPPPPTPEATITLAQLQRFFRHPSRWLLQQRLGLRLRRPDEALSDDEPFAADNAVRGALARRLLPALARQPRLDDGALLALAEAGTELPAGAFGRGFVQAELPALRAHAQALALATLGPEWPPHSAMLDWAPANPAHLALPQPHALHITLTGLRADGLVRHRYDEARASDHLATWLDHLALCACAPAGVAGRTCWLGRGVQFSFKPVDDPLPLLQALLPLYARGQLSPLYFFTRTSWAWQQSGGQLGKARGAWLASARQPFGEQADPHHRLALRGLPDPLEGGLADFEAIAAAVLQPLLDHLDNAEPGADW